MINVIVSGFFNPVGKHHLEYIDAAFDEGVKLAWPWERVQLHIIVNSDEQVKMKGSCPFQDEDERKVIMKKLYPKAKVQISRSSDSSVRREIVLLMIDNDDSILKARKTILCNGGDRKMKNANLEEVEVCNIWGVKMLFGVGGTLKTSSSSSMIERAGKWWVKNKMEASKN